MIYTVLDTETTGLPMTDPKTGEASFSHIDILSFAYLTMDTEAGFIRAKTLYLWEPDFQWSEEAYKVNGLSKEFLKANAGDMTRTYAEMFSVVSRGNLVTYNGDSYDLPLIEDFLQRRAVTPEDYCHNYDIMLLSMQALGSRKRISLINACKSFNISEELIKIVQNQFFGESSRPHDASYDVAATFLLMQNLRGLGYVQI